MFKKKIIRTKDVYLTTSANDKEITQQDLNYKYNKGFEELERRVKQLEYDSEKNYQVIGSLLKYLGLKVKRENIPDPSKLPPEPEMISVLKVYKDKKK
jgi:hypothetical protein